MQEFPIHVVPHLFKPLKITNGTPEVFPFSFLSVVTAENEMELCPIPNLRWFNKHILRPHTNIFVYATTIQITKMPILTYHFYNTTKATKTNHYIETGTYMGDGIAAVLNNYDYIHSIELSEKWYNHNVEQFKQNNNVKLYLGDSKKVLPELLESIQEPITIYLDAHYSGKYTEFGEEETPLLFELEILKNRPFDDIIIIDDCRLLGKTGQCGAMYHPIYPPMTYDWRNITEDKIVNLMKPDYVLLKNDSHQYTNGASDQFILVKQMYGDI